MRPRFTMLAVLLSSTLCACAAAPVRTTSLRIAGAPPDASVTIDDKYVGAFAYVQRRGVAMPPGKHRITIEKQGYFPWDKLVEARDGDAPLAIDVTLTKIPD